MAEEKKKAKRPTALKRDIRNAKRQEINKAFKSKMRSAIRSFEGEAKAGSASAESLNAVYSAVDKGVKRGVIKLNKAKRTKARCAKIAKAV